MNTTSCDKCGVEYGIGDSPWCRDGHTGGGRYGYGAFTPYDDDQVDRNGTVHFGNWGEKLAYMDRNAIVDRSQARFERKMYFDRGGR